MGWFRINIPLLPYRLFGWHKLTISYMGQSHDNCMHLQVMYNGKMYGRVYRNWKLRPIDKEK